MALHDAEKNDAHAQHGTHDDSHPLQAVKFDP